MPAKAMRRPLRLMAPSSRHWRSGRPNCGCSSSQRSKRGELRAKHPTAMMRKMVVGMTGSMAPMKPSATISQPAANQSQRMNASPEGSGMDWTCYCMRPPPGIRAERQADRWLPPHFPRTVAPSDALAQSFCVLPHHPAPKVAEIRQNPGRARPATAPTRPGRSRKCPIAPRRSPVVL